MFQAHTSPKLMGILNLTPDSFSDGGLYTDLASAMRQVETMVAEGVDIVDVGGESTRPGSDPVAADEQIRRVLPIIKAVHADFPTLPISIDTTRWQVADAALRAGAAIINDISAGLDDPDMFALAAANNCPIILMHKQGTPKTMQDAPDYSDVVSEVIAHLRQRIDAAIVAGIKPEQIAIDPGIGFGKRKQDNIDLLANLRQFVELGYPVLLGASRKRFMGSICNVSEAHELVTATAVTTALGVMSGVTMFRVHDVKANRQAADIAWAIKQAQ
ncbi:dihydropteroate synthase [Methylomonas sp. SURF-2]|uniref:Dihydropteroate synthase n=1 Tax=Methylomonas subterranea TaxID=2952225 RepID=A0ABT1THH3_9GAMM|nr:dihydropteroate synthase [Methylomonas sp. SURF-2]MCQ8104909.1 dihydropteroate synthase [Methylomonas sp. SURF-2]